MKQSPEKDPSLGSDVIYHKSQILEDRMAYSTNDIG